MALILPTFSKQERQKRGVVTSLLTGIIGLPYEGISSFSHYKRQKALHKSIQAMDNKVDLQCNRIFHLEDSMTMYGIYVTFTILLSICDLGVGLKLEAKTETRHG